MLWLGHRVPKQIIIRSVCKIECCGRKRSVSLKLILFVGNGRTTLAVNVGWICAQHAFIVRCIGWPFGSKQTIRGQGLSVDLVATTHSGKCAFFRDRMVEARLANMSWERAPLRR